MSRSILKLPVVAIFGADVQMVLARYCLDVAIFEKLDVKSFVEKERAREAALVFIVLLLEFRFFPLQKNKITRQKF